MVMLGRSRRCCSHAVMQQQSLPVFLLVLGSAAVLAAAAPVGLQQRPAAAAARRADPEAGRITSSLAAPADAPPILPQECPGIEANGTVCGKVRGSVRQQRGCVYRQSRRPVGAVVVCGGASSCCGMVVHSGADSGGACSARPPSLPNCLALPLPLHAGLPAAPVQRAG